MAAFVDRATFGGEGDSVYGNGFSNFDSGKFRNGFDGEASWNRGLGLRRLASIAVLASTICLDPTRSTKKMRFKWFLFSF